MKKIYLLAAAALALAACDSNDVNPDDSQQAIKVFATIGESVQSRASDTQWAAGDRIGISSTVGAVGGPYINLKYTTAGTDGNFTGTPMFFYKPMTLTAYYPYSGEEGKVPGDHGVISATTDAAAQKNLPAIDFLWDQQTDIKASDPNKTSEPNVNFKFAHKMSKVSFTFIGSHPVYEDEEHTIMNYDGVDIRLMNSYGIEGLGITGTFDTATGVCAIDETVDREGLTFTFQEANLSKEELDFDHEETYAPLIVFPQSKPEKGFILHIRTNEFGVTQNYKCSLSFSENGIEPGNHYKYKIQVSKRGLKVGDLTIEDWDESDKYICATIDGDKDPEETEGPFE